MFRCCRLLVPVTVLSVLATGCVSRADEGPFPRPGKDAIAKADAKVKEVYKTDLEKAHKASEKTKLAGVLLTAADGVGNDDASRIVLLTMARDLAVDANDKATAMKAVTAMVGRFQPDGATDPKEQIKRGNEPWEAAETAPADKRLGLRFQAAEWYLYAKPAATDLDEALITKRLAELSPVNGGPKPSPVNSGEAKPKAFIVTYWAGNPRTKRTETIHASSVADAKKNVRVRYAHAKFVSVVEDLK